MYVGDHRTAASPHKKARASRRGQGLHEVDHRTNLKVIGADGALIERRRQ